MRQGVPFSFSFTCHVQFKKKQKQKTTTHNNNNTDGKQCVEALTQDFTNQWVTMFIF